MYAIGLPTGPKYEQASVFEAAGALVKIDLNLKPNHHNQV